MCASIAKWLRQRAHGSRFMSSNPSAASCEFTHICGGCFGVPSSGSCLQASKRPVSVDLDSQPSLTIWP